MGSREGVCSTLHLPRAMVSYEMRPFWSGQEQRVREPRKAAFCTGHAFLHVHGHQLPTGAATGRRTGCSLPLGTLSLAVRGGDVQNDSELPFPSMKRGTYLAGRCFPSQG